MVSLKFFVSDLKAASRSSNFLINAKWFLLNHSIHIVFFYRLGQSAARVPIFGKLLRFVVEYAIRVLYASDISCLSKIGEGLIIVHGHDIVIGADVVIGRNCKIFNGVTLGNKDIEQSSKGNQPTLGDHVVLSTGAKLLGPIEIGSYVTIGANSVVLNDCPSRSVVVGVPARVVKKI